ncbi:GMC family oxidoreductase [Rhizohabitans arisaemae]|uniref:GMC family oxidoreductase n=1 Tax=Rhizohabitans arisaemae TaxID=2720610 RepID=UPI0024B28279|nr:GMC family oxidoreductase N-terminal domain-containing protein [Rhizohabitans arisaemae]
MYDYVIVGAGSAGCVLAARLSEDEDVRVLLLEAGPPDDDVNIQVPAAVGRLFKSELDWDYETTPQEQAAGRSVYWPRGRVVGGSSSINAMIYIRGNQLDYDTWQDEYGCAGWSHENMLPYFMRAEDQDRGGSPLHGVNGPLRVEDLRHVHRLTKEWVEAAQAYGLSANPDFNGDAQDGVGRYQVTQRAGRRWSAADAYLRPALDRKNLTVETGALVTRVLIEDGKATGVEYVLDGETVQAEAEREVVLCAGAVNSPQLLMLSGVGPAGHLREHGIEVVVDSPRVGTGLQDHPAVVVMWKTPGVKGLWEEDTSASRMKWKLAGRGPLTSNLAEVGGFVRTRQGLPAPDVQFHVLPSPFADQGLTPPSERLMSVLVTLLAPASRGAITLSSADPQDKPAIDAGYLVDPADLEPLVAGVRLAREIAQCAPLARSCAGEHTPGEEVTGDEELQEFVRSHLITCYHPTSTCAMGGSEEAVCDPELRVRGVEGLRVVDASVMPSIPRGNTNAPTIAIAERAADLIAGREPLAPQESALRWEPTGRDLIRG